jgi:ATP-dependent helicase HrpA
VEWSIDPGLPIASVADQVADLIRCHPVVVLAGETGSGKTTQLPKICLGLGRRRIAHTQPRRIAARSVAARIAQELGQPLGDQVGYQVRFDKASHLGTALKVMTDGILLAEIAHDRDLRRYDTIIVDEAHERSLNIDFLLGYLKQLTARRRDLKVIVTSATIDTARFAAHFDDAPVIEVPGRTYPIELRHRPLDPDQDQAEAVVGQATELWRETPGDILAFFSGEREIKETAALAQAELGDIEVVPLFARLSAAEQSRVFARGQRRRLVLATNVAETSLTVPGVTAVIDTGWARISRYSTRSKVQRLPIEPISQASADQRAGRCGRIGPGICVRLYSEQDYAERPPFTEPEILRTSLASVILRMADARLGDIASFPFVEAPDRSQINDGLRLLDDLGALAQTEPELRLSRIGRQMAALPLDPSLGRILVEAARRDCLREASVIVAGLTVNDVRERPLEQRPRADTLHARFASDAILDPVDPSVEVDPARPAAERKAVPGRPGPGPTRASGDRSVGPGGDLLARWRLWCYLERRRRELSGNQFKRLCRDEFIHYLRVREWSDLVQQLRQATKDLKLPRNRLPAPVDDIVTSCLAGWLGHVGRLEPAPAARLGQRRVRRPVPQYVGPRGVRFALAPDSLLARRPPPLVVAVELVETTRLWAHQAAPVTPEQVEQVAGHLLRRTYHEIALDAVQGVVRADERVWLLGLPLLERRVDYGRVAPAEARAIFIQAGLVEDRWRPPERAPYAAVRAHNLAVKAEIAAWQDKVRRLDLLVDDQTQADFFDQRLPESVTSGPSLDRWLRQEPAAGDRLRASLADLMWSESAVVDPALYPDRWQVGGLDLALVYRFDPGGQRDGVAVRVPAATLAGLKAAPFSWGVPAWRRELASALIRGLPKPVRTRLTPAGEMAERALDWLGRRGYDQSLPFTQELSRALKALTGVETGPWDWRPVPERLKVAFLVEPASPAQPDRAGAKPAAGRPAGQSGGGPAGDQAGAEDQTVWSSDLAGLQAAAAPRLRRRLARLDRGPVAQGLSWVFGPIDERVDLELDGVETVAYPGLRDDGSTVSQVLSLTLAEARRLHRLGLGRLLWEALPDPTRWTVAHLTEADKLALASAPYDSLAALLAEARRASLLQRLDQIAPAWSIRDQAAFAALVDRLRPEAPGRLGQLVKVTAEALRRRAGLAASLEALAQTRSGLDVQAQLDDLIFPGFIRVIPQPWFDRLPTYLRGIERRLEQIAVSPARDLERLDQLEPVLAAYAERWRARPAGSAELRRIGYLIEELRLQLFAQPIKTWQPVSVKRLLQAIAAEEAGPGHLEGGVLGHHPM